MKKIITIIAALTAITAVSACSAKAFDASAETAAPAETDAAAPAVTALETTEDSRAEESEQTEPAEEESVEYEDVEIYAPVGISEAGYEDDTVCFGCAPDETAEARNSVFILSVDPETPEETILEVFDKFELGIVYDYENFNMYAVSVKEPLDAEQTAEFIRSLEEYDFILMVEPDSVVYLDNAEVQ